MSKDIENMTASESNPVDARQEREAWTPGPWACRPNPMRDDGWFVETEAKRDTGAATFGANGMAVPYLVADPIIPVQLKSEANANLIAAAPDLYEALHECQQACLFADDDGGIGVSEDVVIPSELFDRICVALARARGEQQHDGQSHHTGVGSNELDQVDPQ